MKRRRTTNQAEAAALNRRYTREALDLMQTVHNLKCIPAWGEDELRHKVADAWTKAQASPERGCALRDDETTFTPGSPQAEDTWPDDEAAPQELVKLDEVGRPKVRGFAWMKTGLFKSGSPAKTLPSGDEVAPGPPVWIAPAFTLSPSCASVWMWG